MRYQIKCDASPFIAAMKSLEEALQRFPEVIHGFLSALDTPAQLCRVDDDGGLAAGADQLWIMFQPSDLLRDFLAACAGDFNRVPVQV